MMQVWHMSGAGNDFMVIDARGLQLDFSALAVKLCAMTHADGFMALDDSQIADFRLHFYNSDGSRGEMCGNGARCICRFAYDLGIAGEAMVVQTDAGLVPGWRLAENRFRLEMNKPSIYDEDRKPGTVYVELGDPGIPHGVKEVPGLTWEMADELREAARALRYESAFPKGANINLYTWLGEGHVRVLTFERGVEDYTLACGTGCTATAVTLWKQGKLPGGVLTAENKGGTLQVRIEAAGDTITSLLLEGGAEVVHIYEL
jgi:diaminopimelate epimerase